jgi:hypothetical protein
MRRIPLVALLVLVVVGCESTKREVPESRVETRTSPDYEKVRPVTIAVLPVQAPRQDLKTTVRHEVYKILPERKYSPFKLTEVDAHVDAQGKFDGEGLDWDATLEIVFDKWVPTSGNYWAASGHATMTHKTGEVLWTCDFQDYAFPVPSRNGVSDQEEAATDIAYFLVGSKSGRLPDCPPPPPE